MAIKDVLAHCKNRLPSIRKQITCPDGHENEQFGNCQFTSGF